MVFIIIYKIIRRLINRKQQKFTPKRRHIQISIG
jgi:hypothetical protein